MTQRKRVGPRCSALSFAIVVVFAGTVAACANNDAQQESSGFSLPRNDSSLYRRLGGYDVLAAITDTLLARVAADTALNVFFAGIPPEHVNRIRQMVVDQLCAASGGPCRYVGKSMREAHATLDITNDVFEKFMGHLQSTLATFAVSQREQDEVLAALNSLKTEIVTK